MLLMGTVPVRTRAAGLPWSERIWLHAQAVPQSLVTWPLPMTRTTASVALSGSTAATQYDLSPSGEMTATMGKRTIIKRFHTESHNYEF